MLLNGIEDTERRRRCDARNPCTESRPMTAPAPALRPGTTADVTAEVKREQGDRSPLRVQLVPPDGVDFSRASDATIAAGQGRVQPAVHASSRSRPGSYGGLSVRISAGPGGKA